ncbi:siderophore-interacting protein [Mariniluteicoccus endophyticus]
MSNITVTQEGGALHAEVLCSTRVSPGFQRVTVTGPDLARLVWRGFDQWVRLFLPPSPGAPLRHVPDRMSRLAYARMMAVPAAERPAVRNYTLRAWRPGSLELDIDFVLHGPDGVAGPWAAAATAGDRVALLDQGCGWPSPHADRVLLVGDETGVPAVLGVLRDLPRASTGLALLEVTDAADRQPVDAPDGVEVRWLERPGDTPPGDLIVEALGEASLPAGGRHAFAVGEARLATGARRHLVRGCGWAKDEVTFCGYWRR